MEKLLAAMLYLLRFVGLHPFKTKQYMNQIQISVWLLLWTLFLQLMTALSAMYYLVNNSNISSLQIFLRWVWSASWQFYPIFISIHFLCHAKEIAAANRRIINVLGMCSISSLKMSIKIKLIIILSVFANIFFFSAFVYIQTLNNCSNSQYAIVFWKLTKVCVDCFAIFIYTITSLIFVIYLAILEEYFSYNDSCLGELFDRKQYFIGQQFPIIPTKLYSDKPKNAATHPISVHKPKNPATHPISVHKSIYPQQSVNRIKTRSTLPYPRQTKDSRPRLQFTKSHRIRAENVSTKNRVYVANTQDFIQNMEKIHSSIFELYNIYELLKCVLGFPLLYLIILITIDSCASTYVAVTGLRVDCNSAIWILIPLTEIFNIILITIVPHTLDDKVSNVISIGLIKVYQ